MLSNEKIQAHLLAYDRPSPKLLGFLAKHYNLRKFVHQNNNFVIFNEFFQTIQRPQKNYLPEGGFRNLGQQIMNTNTTVTNGNFTYNQENKNLPTPNKLFANYYLNKNDTNYYDQIYSKKKINLINDYNSSTPKDSYEYVRYFDLILREQLDFKGKEISNAKERMKQLESEVIHRTNNNNSYYNKRNDFFTIFDDKKTLNINSDPSNFPNNMPENGNNFSTGNCFIDYPSVNRERTPIKPNVLPTTSSSYGAYFNYTDPKDFYKNKINTNRIFY
jgi:hypothetical protein